MFGFEIQLSPSAHEVEPGKGERARTPRMDKRAKQVDDSWNLVGPGLPTARAIIVLGTPVREDVRGRMTVAIALIRHNRGEVIIALGTPNEARQMKKTADKNRVFSNTLILDDNSRTTIDNAYFAKKICQRLNLVPSVLVTSQYQASRAAITFHRVFGPSFSLNSYSSPSLTSTTRRVRETILSMSTPLFFLFRKGDDEGLKRASDFLWKLLRRNDAKIGPVSRALNR
jgi:DUF218 domain-containing protein